MLYSQEKISIQNVEYEVRLYLKRTRNFSYRIRAQKIGITLPDFYKRPSEIEAKKQEWLQYAIERIVSDKKLSHIVPFKQWEKISIFGREYNVVIDESIRRNRYNPDTETFEVRHNLDQDKIKKIFAKFILNNFQNAVEKRVVDINDATLQRPIKTIELKHHHSRWGSCSSKGELTLSVNTLLTPLWVIDYVIVHELCHLIHLDHSMKFWNEVKKYYPKYKEAVKYLKEQGMGLTL